MDDVRVHTGTLLADLALPQAASLKDMRRALQALKQRLRNRELAVAQVGPAELTQRAFLAVSAVSGSATLVTESLDAAERLLFASEFEGAGLRREVSVISEASGGR